MSKPVLIARKDEPGPRIVRLAKAASGSYLNRTLA